jgi:hypothetical protein
MTVDAAFDVSCERYGGVLVVSQAYHALNESAPFNMIDAALKSHFYLIVVRKRAGNPS